MLVRLICGPGWIQVVRGAGSGGGVVGSGAGRVMLCGAWGSRGAVGRACTGGPGVRALTLVGRGVGGVWLGDDGVVRWAWGDVSQACVPHFASWRASRSR